MPFSVSDMQTTLQIVFAMVREAFLSRAALHLENLALRQQLAVAQRESPRPSLCMADRLFLGGVVPRVAPLARGPCDRETRDRHRLAPKGLPAFLDLEIATKKAGPTADFEGSPRPHPTDVPREPAVGRSTVPWGAAEARLRRFRGGRVEIPDALSEAAVADLADVPRQPRGLSRFDRFLWVPTATFAVLFVFIVLRHERRRIEFFVVPTATFAVLFVFIVLRHERRRIEYFGVTAHPSADWVAQQIREAFPWDTAPRYLIRDRDGAYGQSFRSTVMAMGVEEVVTAPRSPWQNPYVERLIGSVRRECLNHVIVLNERHLRRILVSSLDYYHRSRTHLITWQGHPRGAIGSARWHRKDRGVSPGRWAPSSVRAARGLNTAGFCLRVLVWR